MSLEKLHAATEEFCGKRGMNAKTIALITSKVVGLISAHWEHIADSAHDEENEGQIAFSIRVAMDMSHKTPSGTAVLSFTPKKVNDETDWKVEDPDQPPLFPPGQATGRAPRPPRRRTTNAAAPTAVG